MLLPSRFFAISGPRFKTASENGSQSEKIPPAISLCMPENPYTTPDGKSGAPPVSPVPVRISTVCLTGIYIIIAMTVFSACCLSGSGTIPSIPGTNGSTILPVNGQCAGNLTLCSGTCVDLQTDRNNCGACGFAAPFGETCQNGQFSSSPGSGSISTPAQSIVPASTTLPATSAGAPGSCTGGRTSCNGTCRDLLLDSANCGFCGNTCAAGYDCRNGICSALFVTTTPPVRASAEQLCARGEILCGSSCADLFTDKKNCGVCGRACKEQEICVDARCGPACSDSGDTLCGDQCADLDTDMDNCGSCGNRCPSTPPNAKGSLCAQGKCLVSGCKTDFADCNANIADGCEINLRINANNCGSCGNRCSSGQVCYNLKCSVPIKT